MRPKLNISAAVKKSINLDSKTANREFSVSLGNTESNIEQNIVENTENHTINKEIDKTPPNKSINKPNSNKKSMFNLKKATLKPKIIQTATENENIEENQLENEENIRESVKVNNERHGNRENIEETVEKVMKAVVKKLSTSRFNIKKAVEKEGANKIVTERTVDQLQSSESLLMALCVNTEELVGDIEVGEVQGGIVGAAIGNSNIRENVEVGEKIIAEKVIEGEEGGQQKSRGTALVGNRIENMEENVEIVEKRITEEENIEENRGNIDEIVREANKNNEEVRKLAVRKPSSSRFNIKKAVLKEVPKKIVAETENTDKSISKELCNSSESLLLRISIDTDGIGEPIEVGEKEIAVEEGQGEAAVCNRVENLEENIEIVEKIITEEENIELVDKGTVEKEVEEQGNTGEVTIDNNKHSGVHKLSINVRNAESKHVSTTQIRTSQSPIYKRSQQNDNDNASVTTEASSIGNLSSKRKKKNLFVLKNLSLVMNNGDDDVIDTSQMSLKSMINLSAKLPAASKLREQQQKKNNTKGKLNKVEEDKKEEVERGKKEEEGGGPFRIDVDGNIVMNTLRTNNNKNLTMMTEGMTVVVEDAGFLNTTYGSFIKRKLSGRRWGLIETDNFYKALFVVGTNFSAMESIFEGRTRNDLKKKFKVEEKLKPEHIKYILMNPQPYNLETIKFDSHIKKIKKRKDAVKRILNCSKVSDSDQSEECISIPKKRKFSLNPSLNGLNLADGDLPEYF